MIACVGDVHGQFGPLARLVAALPPALPTLQVGDLAAYPPEHRASQGRLPADQWTPLDRPLYFVRGNHDYLPALRDLEVPTEVLPGLVYLPDGVHALGGLRVGVLGGAESVDGPARTPGVDWWPAEEGVGAMDVTRLFGDAQRAGGIDLLVTHTPPASVVAAMLHAMRGLGRAPADGSRDASPSARAPARDAAPTAPPENAPSGESPSAGRVEAAWRALGQPPLVCGHMHRPWREGVVEVLGVLGVTLRTLHRGQVRRPGGVR